MTTGRSVLVLCLHPERRLAAADAFRGEGADVVEVATVEQADAILRKLRFDVLAVDPRGLAVAVTELLHDLSADYPNMCISIMDPPVDGDVPARAHGSGPPSRPATCGEQRGGPGEAVHHGEGESEPADGSDRIRGAGRPGRTDVPEGK